MALNDIPSHIVLSLDPLVSLVEGCYRLLLSSVLWKWEFRHRSFLGFFALAWATQRAYEGAFLSKCVQWYPPVSIDFALTSAVTVGSPSLVLIERAKPIGEAENVP